MDWKHMHLKWHPPKLQYSQHAYKQINGNCIKVVQHFPQSHCSALPDFCSTSSTLQKNLTKAGCIIPLLSKVPLLSGKMQNWDHVCWWLVRKNRDICQDRICNQHSPVSLRNNSVKGQQPNNQIRMDSVMSTENFCRCCGWDLGRRLQAMRLPVPMQKWVYNT